MSSTNKGGATFPVRSAGLFGWDGTKWLEIEVDPEAGSLSVNLKTWGTDPAVELTGRDITTDIQSLTDMTVDGLLQAVGSPGTGYTDATTAYTVRKFLELIYTAVSSNPWDAVSTEDTETGTATFCEHDTGTNGGRTNVTVIIYNAANSCAVDLEGSIDDATYYALQTINVGAGGGTTVVNLFNALRYLRLNQTAVGGGTTTGIIATSR